MRKTTRIAVSDTGRGMAAEDVRHVFDRFYRGASSDRRSPGTGLGLPIVKSLVELHGGTIDVRSELGVGTTFAIALPSAAGGPMSQAPAPSRLASRRVLIVDDEPALAALIARQLEPLGMETVQVHSGQDALERLRSEHFDAMTLDVLMPGMNGFDVLEAIRADPHLRSLPVIFVSVSSTLSRLDGEWAVAKPIDRQRLSDVLHSAIQANRSRGARRRARRAAHPARPGARGPGRRVPLGVQRGACRARRRRRAVRGRARALEHERGAEARRERGASRPARRPVDDPVLDGRGRRTGRRRRHAGLPARAGDRGAADDARYRVGRRFAKMRGVDTDDELRARIDTLEVELSQRTDEAAEKELQLQRYAADLRDTFMEERTRSEELRRSYMLTVRALSNAVEARDAYTGRHAERVAAYGLAIAEVYGMRLSDQPEIEFGFLLHDVGKVAVPDAILFKPGPLTETQRLVMQEHPVTGSKIVREIEFLGAARDVIRSHHERWDGTGYPDGLAGDGDPALGARLRRRRHARCADDAPAVPRALDDHGGASRDRRGIRVAFRP